MKRILIIGAACLSLAGCGNTTAQQQAVTCLTAVAPTVLADATAANTTNAQKGINSGLAVVTNPACVAAAGALVTPTTAPTTAAPATAPASASTPAS